MSAITFLILALATWRVASLLVNEEGPFSVFLRLRRLAGIQYDPMGEIEVVPDKFFAGVLSCVWCCSVWVGLFWAAFYFISPSVCEIIAIAPALSAGAIIVEGRIRA